jgi:hypothetical protein
MRVLGYLLLTVGLIGLVFGLNFDASIALNNGHHIDTLGRLAEKQNVLMVSAVLATVGAILVVAVKASLRGTMSSDATRAAGPVSSRREQKLLREHGILYDGTYYAVREFRFTDAGEALAKAEELAVLRHRSY